ncbi:MAG: exodeoxyribonuclease I [Coxiella sp. (in: Bacteria)]|nr:MAG: exodeoxyribonuclease I [Coxiella sp. (in: g-proteobacteria)]
MAQNSFLFYDIETTGLNKCFDQVLQFAAIRTDMDLKELSRHEIRIKLNPDVIPSPYAVIVHHISLPDMQQGVNEVDGIREIHKLLNKRGTISVGYNTLGFDDEFLRFSFYKNLLPPYTHQYANQCGRMDIYPLTVLYYLFKRDCLTWPQKDGKISLKLENLGAENNLMHGKAHDAMVDVEATLALARKLREHQKMWDFSCGYFDKKTDISRGDKLPIAFETDDRLFREGLLVSGKFGAANQFIAPVLSLGQHKHYKNQTLWLRLDKDITGDNAFVIRKKMGENAILLPPETRYLQHLSSERQQLAAANKKQLLDNPKHLAALCEQHQHFKYPVQPNVDIDAALYDQKFPTPQEEKLFRDFHQAKPQDKMAIADRFSNTARRDQAVRIMARNYPDYLSDDDRHDFEDYMQAKTVDFRGEQKLNQDKLQELLLEIKQKTLTPEQEKLLDDFDVTHPLQ